MDMKWKAPRTYGRCILPGTKRTKNSRQRRLVREDLPLRTPRRGSGKSKPSQQGTSGPDIETIATPYASLRQRLRPKTASGGSRSAQLVALTSFAFVVCLCRFRRLRPGLVWLRQLPSRHALQHAVGVLDGVHVSVVAFNHVDGSSHLLGKEIHVHTFLQAERGIGVPEAIGRARDALSSFAQIRFVQKIGNQGTIQRLCRLARDIGKYSVILFGGFGDGCECVLNTLPRS